MDFYQFFHHQGSCLLRRQYQWNGSARGSAKAEGKIRPIGKGSVLVRILVISYSQSGQLTEIVRSFISPLMGRKEIRIEWHQIVPVEPYPFPWPVWKFFEIFPECIFMIPPQIEPICFESEDKFDLAVLAYQPWYFSPSLPMAAFLASPEAEVLKDTPVITLSACKDTWLMAQEKVKSALEALGATLIDHVSFRAQGSRLASFITTPLWLWTGVQHNFPGILPPAGVDRFDIYNARRFGHAIRIAVQTSGLNRKNSILHGLGAVKVDPDMIPFENAVHWFFQFWAKILLFAGKPGQVQRVPVLLLFLVVLLGAMGTAIPLALIMRCLVNPLRKKKIAGQIAYYEQPSGSDTDKLTFLETDKLSNGYE